MHTHHVIQNTLHANCREDYNLAEHKLLSAVSSLQIIHLLVKLLIFPVV